MTARLPPSPGRHDEVVDIALVLEGTYPFVSGGVSSWVHHLIRELDDLSFGLVHVSPRRGYYERGPVYDAPPNVRWLTEVPLQDLSVETGTAGRAGDTVKRFGSLLERLRDDDASAFPELVRQITKDGARTAWEVLQTRAGWQLLVDVYRREASRESFSDFFWTWRYSHLPILKIVSANVPRARLFHTISTGYAGLLAAAARLRHDVPMLLTEHGIYTKERRIDVQRADWIPDWDSGEIVARADERYFHAFWARQFEALARICYRYADAAYTLFGGNVTLQRRDGLPPEKANVVPNGIDLTRFGAAAQKRRERPADHPFTIGFVGRVCPIKDIKTFVYAMRLVADQAPDVDVRLMGPWDEDPEYAEQCRALVSSLELDDVLAFEGRVNVAEELSSLDVLVLTSISEAQPLVILEAGAAGVPIVATDVGSCRELLLGRDAEDRAFGQGGFVTPIATPSATAEAVLRFVRDRALADTFGENLRKRVFANYAQSDMVAAYREIYVSRMSDPVEAAR